MITQIAPNSPAEKAGLKSGDVILKINGTPILRTVELFSYLNRLVPGQTVQFEVLRDDKRQNISAKLSTAPDDTPAKNKAGNAQNKGPVLGVSIRDLTAQEQSRLSVKGGVLLQDVLRGGAASQARLIPGDIIVQVNSRDVKNASEFVETVAQFKKNNVVRMTIIRDGQRAIVGVRIQ